MTEGTVRQRRAAISSLVDKSANLPERTRRAWAVVAWRRASTTAASESRAAAARRAYESRAERSRGSNDELSGRMATRCP